MLFLTLVIIIIVLVLAWISFSGKQPIKRPLVYRQGDNRDPDSDADMQEQYEYINKKNHD